MMNHKGSMVALLAFLMLGLVLAFSSTASAQTGKVNVNIATPEQLAQVPGMTPELAKAIVAYKASNGSLSSPDDLMKVPGMTPEIFKKLSPSVDTDGNVLVGAGKPAASGDEDEAPVKRY